MPLILEDSQDNLVRLENALVVPPLSGKNSRAQPSGVLDSNHRFVEQSTSWTRSNEAVNSPAELPHGLDGVKTLNGSYVFGGIFYGHFGHFIVESLSRIWALDQIGEPLDGLIFTPKGPRITQRHVETFRGLLSSFGVEIPVVIAHDVTRVSDLHVPRQGFGMYDLIEGSPAFRAYISRHAGRDIPASGPESLYISRSQLGPNRGSILGEYKLEKHLSAEGYEIFHPQKASHEEQIARYKAAKRIIATDCSPLHLAGYVGNADQRVGIVTRRSMDIGSYLVRQFDSFTGAQATEFNCLVNDWIPQPGHRPSRSSWGEVDFQKLHGGLLSAGLVSSTTPWPDLTGDERDQELRRIETSHGTAFKPFAH